MGKVVIEDNENFFAIIMALPLIMIAMTLIYQLSLSTQFHLLDVFK